ncbi:MAG: c-type cytochrome [Alphaproteobacteria bacterium]|nr:c-type cytochrome [Alphaproteobacteria bacterium]
MMRAALLPGVLALVLFTTLSVAFTPGDPVRGEKVFRKCKACHSIEAGRNRPAGPNLLGVFGRQAGTADYRFSTSMIEAGEAGLVWTPERVDAYIADPKAFLKETLGVSRVRNKMVFRLKDGDQRADVIAFLMSLEEEDP